MADPEQIFQEVLKAEQDKGSAPPVAEARAKAARARAEHGSPHPTEPKWWPGSQPRWEGGEAAAPAADEEPAAEAEAAPEPEPEAPAAEETPAPAEPAAAPVQPAADQQTVPAEQAPAPAAAAPQPVAAAAATAAPARPAGVAPGTPTGNRLRPEDSVATESQFDAQRAMVERRRIIDELVATGVPAAASADRPQRRGGGLGLFVAYLLIVALAVGYVVANREDLAADTAAAEEGGEGEGGGEGGEGGTEDGLTISAANVQFDTSELTLPADQEAELLFKNEDASSVPHNVSIYESEGGPEIFIGDTIPGGQEITYAIPATKKGSYYFQCDVHPGMNGDAVFE